MRSEKPNNISALTLLHRFVKHRHFWALGFSALIIIFGSFRPANNNDKLVVACAESQLPSFLERIPPGHESSYGFREMDDLDLCTVGNPFRVVIFNTDFYNSPPEEGKNYLDVKNEWLAPVTIKGENRTMLRVSGNPGNYAISGMGDTTLAQELQPQSKGEDERYEYYILRIPTLHADIIVAENNSSFIEARFTLLPSAVTALATVNTYAKSTFSLAEIEKIVKEALAKHNSLQK